jgi:hypothetical protein
MHALHEQLLKAVVPAAFAVAFGAGLRDAPALPSDGHVVAEGACRAFAGSVSGNDPDVRVRATLCRVGDDVRGQLVWHGASGISVRELAGSVEPSPGGERLTLVDARITLDAPNPGWMFCPVDEYALVWDPRGATLTGTYASAACDDHAGIWLAVD